MLFYSYLIAVSQIYNGITRRNREDYLQHCLRVAMKLEKLHLSERTQLLGLLHDALEVNTNISLEQLIDVFTLSISEVFTLQLLTALPNETSQQHFERVLNSQDVNALYIKYCDCFDNSEFEPSDFVFTLEVLNKNPDEEITKYKDRMLQVKNKLNSLGFKVYL